jgi:hypothetical protein
MKFYGLVYGDIDAFIIFLIFFKILPNFFDSMKTKKMLTSWAVPRRSLSQAMSHSDEQLLIYFYVFVIYSKKRTVVSN